MMVIMVNMNDDDVELIFAGKQSLRLISDHEAFSTRNSKFTFFSLVELIKLAKTSLVELILCLHQFSRTNPLIV